MLGVLKIVLRCNNIAAYDFSLRQGHITLIASLRILIAPGPVARAIRVPPLGAGVERAGRSGLARVHVCLQAILDGSLLGRACEYFKRGDQPPGSNILYLQWNKPPGYGLRFLGLFSRVGNRRRPADMNEIHVNKQAQDNTSECRQFPGLPEHGCGLTEFVTKQLARRQFGRT